MSFETLLIKWHATDWEKILSLHKSDKELASRTHKNFHHSMIVRSDFLMIGKRFE